jgi:NAD(P)H-quinone oxidoreductase subunit 2
MDLTLIREVLMPEILVLFGILITLGMSLFENTKNFTSYVSAFILGLASILVLQDVLPKQAMTIVFDSFVLDSLSVFFRFLIYFVSMLVVLASTKYLRVLESPSEYYPILMTASLGAAFLVASNDFLLMFVSLETLGLSAILLASYARLNQKSNEAGIKYLINSSAVTGILLLGISFLYGLTGTTNFALINLFSSKLLAYGLVSSPLLLLISLLFVGVISFKLAAVPFHNWSPDVYEGAPTTTTYFLSVVSKLAAFGLAIRLFAKVLNFGSFAIYISAFLALLAIASILLGNYVAITQIIHRGSIKRLLAYSSIAQVGYMMIGLSLLKMENLSSLVFYLFIYAIMNSLAFIVIIYFEQETGSDKIYDYAGLIKKRPGIALAFALALINLAGLPLIPAAFVAKFFLFSSAFTFSAQLSSISTGQILALVGLLGSVLGVFYYLYLIKITFVNDLSSVLRSLQEASPKIDSIKVALVLSVLLLVFFGTFGLAFIKQFASQVINGVFIG